ncbi:BTAD domain-containing putative transcriptional regulator, partial [Frankia sp. CiP1_Cm_nod2]|uniref:BTAD domain-containing putative transcriptional regulator n=1 Tax=Frankia sp. CiP1_Cm_nod2 TaxID=2897161 RepID=UPI00202537B0
MDVLLLGPVQLLKSGRVVEVGRPQRCLVLAALAADAGRPVSTKTLIDRVWGEGDGPERPSRSLHAHISGLRRLFEQHSDEQRAVRIPRRAEGYILDLGPERVDVFRMRRLLEHARTADGDDGALPALREAVRLWRGEPLVGLTESLWVERIRRIWRQEWKEVVVAWASAELKAGNAPAVIEPLRDLTHDDLCYEGLVTVLMRALYATGKRGEALALYRSARDRIVEDHGLEPGPEMMQVHLGILRGDLEEQAPRQYAGASYNHIPTASQEQKSTTSRDRDPAVSPEQAHIMLRGQAPGTPLMVGSLPPRADSFQQRAESEKLHNATRPGQTTVLTQVVAGLGGV